MKKLLSVLILLLIPHYGHAAIAVVDAQNIAQTAKVYAETVKTVANTAEQIKLQAQELLSLPTEWLNEYITSFTSSINKITNTVNNAGYNFSTNIIADEIETYWNNKFVTVPQEMINDATVRDAQWTRREKLSVDNKKYAAAYASFQKQLAEESKKLSKLMLKNSEVVGQKQSAQLANQIAAVKANINIIQTNLKLLNNKRELEKQADNLTEYKNRITLEKKQAADILKAAEKLDVTSKEKVVGKWGMKIPGQ